MTTDTNIIKEYLELKEKINSENYFIGFVTCEHKKRLLLKQENTSKIYAITNRFKILETKGDKEFDNFFDFLESYFLDPQSVDIKTIEFFETVQEATSWLFGEKLVKPTKQNTLMQSVEKLDRLMKLSDHT